jgi:hypothetical protein
LIPAVCPSSYDDPAIPGLSTVQVKDLDHDGDRDQADIDMALGSCAALNGCNLLFKKGTWENVEIVIDGGFPNGLSIGGAGIGETVLRGPVVPANYEHKPIIHVTGSAPDGIIIQNITLDGVKDEKPPIAGACPNGSSCFTDDDCEPESCDSTIGYASGISTLDPGLRVRRNGIVRGIEVRNMLYTGVDLRGVDGWVVECNWLHNFGCNTRDEPCGQTAGLEQQWESVPAFNGSLPYRKVNGWGVFVKPYSFNVEVRNNLVEHATKFGIQTYEPAGAPCPSATTCPVTAPSFAAGNEPPMCTTFSDNIIRGSSWGVVVNGGCGAVIRGNTAECQCETLDEYWVQTGSGFHCAGGGADTVWEGNIAQNNHAHGFSMACLDGNWEFTDNESANNCLRRTAWAGDMTFSTYNGVSIDPVLIEDVTSRSPNCYAGIRIQNRENVTIGGALIGNYVEGGREFGLWVDTGANYVDISDTTVDQGTGVGLYGIAIDPTATSLTIQDNNVIAGYEPEGKLCEITQGSCVPFDCSDDTSSCGPPTWCGPDSESCGAPTTDLVYSACKRSDGSLFTCERDDERIHLQECGCEPLQAGVPCANSAVEPTCVSLLFPACPNTSSCGPVDQCTLDTGSCSPSIDYGYQTCVFPDGELFACPGGQTVHLQECDCSALQSGVPCANTAMELVCE